MIQRMRFMCSALYITGCNACEQAGTVSRCALLRRDTQEIKAMRAPFVCIRRSKAV
jgi:hypothetical protein